METESGMFKMKSGDKAIEFSLKGVDGNNYSVGSFSGKDALVVVFTCNHCPYAQAYESRLISLAREFSEKAAFVAINSNDSKKYPQDSFENMRLRANEKGFPYPYLHDETQEVARGYGALVTPHVFVFDRDRKLAFQGGIDDNWENGSAATRHYLKEALSAIAAASQPVSDTAPAVGCSIKWKE